MSYLLKRVRKLEERSTDIRGFVPYSEEWHNYWEGKLDQLLTGELPGGERIPLEYIDSVREGATRAAGEVAFETERCR